VKYKIEEEKMAVVIQEVVGHNYNNKFYPSISGVAQSYNYYPVSYMKPEDGFSVAAVGLGIMLLAAKMRFGFARIIRILIQLRLTINFATRRNIFMLSTLQKPISIWLLTVKSCHPKIQNNRC
jgi:hypothetical protein